LEVVQVDNLSFSYGLEFRLKDVSLSVNEGDVVVLLGPNGCGKTTLLKCINALLRPERGTVHIGGKDAFKMDRNDLAQLVGYVPQVHSPPFPYTVIDIVLMGRVSRLGIFQQPSRRDYAKAEETLKLVGLYRLKDRPYTQISGGERQLVLIARAIAQEPKVLLLDEPTAHLDFKNQLMILRMVKMVAKEKGLGVVMSLHDPNHALLFSDYVALMGNGVITAFGRPEEVVTAAKINEVYGMEIEVVALDKMKFVVPKIS
jgi:iron complex transport system ATP-binding protein